MHRPLAQILFLHGLAIAGSALGWTPPLEISAPSGSERSTPRIARGNNGTLNVVYLNKGGVWSIHYRQKSAAGNWGPVEQVSSVCTAEGALNGMRVYRVTLPQRRPIFMRVHWRQGVGADQAATRFSFALEHPAAGDCRATALSHPGAGPAPGGRSASGTCAST